MKLQNINARSAVYLEEAAEAVIPEGRRTPLMMKKKTKKQKYLFMVSSIQINV